MKIYTLDCMPMLADVVSGKGKGTKPFNIHSLLALGGLER